MQLSDAEWKARLTPEQYKSLRDRLEEPFGSGKYLNHDEKGLYNCAACNAPIFDSDKKYESEIWSLSGWPSFSDVISSDAIVLSEDNRGGMQRTEVSCRNCGGHLGHIFPDDSSPNGQHYCINSVALDFTEQT